MANRYWFASDFVIEIRLFGHSPERFWLSAKGGSSYGKAPNVLWTIVLARLVLKSASGLLVSATYLLCGLYR